MCQSRFFILPPKMPLTCEPSFSVGATDRIEDHTAFPVPHQHSCNYSHALLPPALLLNFCGRLNPMCSACLGQDNSSTFNFGGLGCCARFHCSVQLHMAGPITILGRSNGEFCVLYSSMLPNDPNITIKPPIGTVILYPSQMTVHPSRLTSSLTANPFQHCCG